MKKISIAILAAAAVLVSCKKAQPTAVFNLTAQLQLDGKEFAQEGINITVTDGTVTLSAKSDAKGQAVFSVPAASYDITATGVITKEGHRFSYNGTAKAAVSSADVKVNIAVVQSVGSQIIIKELYCTGCTKDDGSTSYSDDAYVILYNNSDVEADATDIVFTFAAPYNGNGTNKYYGEDGKLKYENLDWLPAYGAIWWFQGNSVKIPPYSQIVVAIFGAIDHTKTVSASVDLSNAAYYWMSNKEISTIYKLAKYTVSENIPVSNYLTTYPFTSGSAWALSNSAPAFYIGKMPRAEVDRISKDTQNYDTTLGTTSAWYVVKFPKANVVDAVEVWAAAQVEKSQVRFPQAINTGYVTITNKQGHTIYRNVDKEATEAIEGNAGKLVTGYKADPSGIDAEASIANGAKIVYKDTNNSTNDFHEREKASLKK